MAVRRIITNRAKKSIRNLYWKSTRKHIQRKQETKSLVDAMIELVDTTPLSPSSESRGILGVWKSKGYTIYESTHCFVRKTSGIRCKPMDSKQNLKRKWFFACVVDIRRNTVYIVNAVFAKYIDRLADNTPTAIKFMNAMKGVYTRRSKQDAERRQLTIPFPENESKKYLLKQLVNECVDRCLKKYLNENLKTHDDEYNIYDKLDELDISYDFINEWENIIEIRTPNKEIKDKVFQLLNYYGWKAIRDNGWSICAERIFGDVWNNFYDCEAEKEDDYPYGVGIYYHLTPSYKVPKILKQGLTVREGNKLGYARGERTYLISYPGKDFAYSLFRDRQKKIEVSILLVDIRKYLGKQINIYHDDFTSDDGAVYTYDYIPPQCIKVYDTFEIS